MKLNTQYLMRMYISSYEIFYFIGGKRELSLLAHKIAVSLQTIAKVKDSQWVHKCLVHKLLMPAFADWSSQKGLEEELGLTSYINTDNSRAISNPVAMCIISVFGMLSHFVEFLFSLFFIQFYYILCTSQTCSNV